MRATLKALRLIKRIAMALSGVYQVSALPRATVTRLYDD